jgi:hypothetical protein
VATQPAFRLDDHVHPISETCPTCFQPVSNEQAKEIRARADAEKKKMAADADARAALRVAAETTRIEEAAKTKIEQAEREKVEAVAKISADATAKIEAAKLEGQRSGEAAAAQKLADAQKAKADAEKAKTDAEAAAAQRVADAEQARAETETAAAQKIAAAEEAAKTRQEDAQKQVDAANAKARQAETDRDAAVEARGREVREAMEKDTAEKIAALNSVNDEKTRKLLEHVQTLERKLEERRASDLGEGAHIKLLDELKKEFPDDHIRRISPGHSGADILHTIMKEGVACGSILYESKNAQQWREDFVTKLVKDQTAAEADHAVLATFKFPKDTAQVEIREEGVIVVNPARAVAVAQILRSNLLHVHMLRLSKSERQEKMAALYDFMTSKQFGLLMSRLDTHSDALLALQEKDRKYHERHWQDEGTLIRSVQKVKGDIANAVELIIGGSPQPELTE